MIKNNPLHNPYPSKRSLVYARNGMVAASQPLAAQVGRDMLSRGGNAVDAAIATAAALTVVEPTSCGIGGDAFAIVWFNGTLHGLNASGSAPQKLTSEAVTGQGYIEMPMYGWTPVTVPGCPAGWAALSDRFGALPFADLLQPAIKLAQEGFPVSPVISFLWNKDFQALRGQLSEAATEHWFSTFAPEGRAPVTGEIFRSEAHARTLESLAQSRCESFYRGELAEAIDGFSRKTGGFLRKEDLAAYQPEWVKPIKANYRGYDIWEIPPNGQGIVALMALKIASGFELQERETLDSYHTLIEALKLAYVDGQAYVTQPASMSVSADELLSDSYANARRKLICNQALTPQVGDPTAGGTVYLATADQHGNMVSFIQSNYHGFGSGVVIPDTGIALQNRGHNFSLDPAHDNYLAPGKKTFHTIIPGFITQRDQAIGPFGVMGAFMQPQGHLQMITNMLDFKLNPQAALDAPRWQWFGGKKIGLEPAVPEHIVQGLAARGHEVEIATDVTIYGRGQIILRDPEPGVLCGATESRTDGHIAVL